MPVNKYLSSYRMEDESDALLAKKYELAETLEKETLGILAFRDDAVDPGEILTKCQSEAQDRSV